MKDFTRYEYQERLERMTNLLKEAEGWGDAYDSSTGQTLIQLMAHATDELHYMLQRRTLENYLETATLRSSVIARACELGYRFKRAKANRGNIKLVLENPATVEVIIPIFTRFESEGVGYISTETAAISVGDIEVTIPVKQGELVSESREIETGDIVTLTDYEFIDNENIIINTTQGQYFDVRTQSDVNKRALSFLGPTDQFYDIKYSVNGMCIVFGDNFQGRRPDTPVDLTYVIVNPDNEEINTLGNDFSVTDTIAGLDGLSFEITNVSRINSGSDPESSDSIRRNASDYHRTNGRAVTNSDYNFWMRDIDGIDIVDARTIGEEELRTVVFNLNNVYITYLKEDGVELSTQELNIVNDFMQTVKTTQAHLIFRPAKILPLQLIADVGRNRQAPIAEEEVYDILYRFFVNYFKLREGTIGKEYQASDIVNDMYRLTVTRNNIVFPVIDYVKLKIKGVIDVDFPINTDEVEIVLSKSYVPQNGDFFVLRINDVPVQVEVFSSDSIFDIVDRMAEAIINQLRLLPKILISGILFNYDDELVNVEKMEEGNTFTFQSEDNDFTISRVSFDPVTKVEHFFYGRLEGRKPTIPIFDGTSVTFTAPSDTNVRIFTRTDFSDYGTETLLTTISAGQTYTNTFTDTRFIVFDYVNNSNFDAVVDVIYPSPDLFSSVIDLTSEDGMSTFTVDKNFGDLINFVQLNFGIDLIHKTPDESLSNAIGEAADQNVILPESVVIYNDVGDIVMIDDGNGNFIDTNGDIVPNIDVSYVTGLVRINDSFATDPISISYSQNIFDNMIVEDNVAMKLIEPKDSISSTEESLSTIRIFR